MKSNLDTAWQLGLNGQCGIYSDSHWWQVGQLVEVTRAPSLYSLLSRGPGLKVDSFWYVARFECFGIRLPTTNSHSVWEMREDRPNYFHLICFHTIANNRNSGFRWLLPMMLTQRKISRTTMNRRGGIFDEKVRCQISMLRNWHSECSRIRETTANHIVIKIRDPTQCT